MARLEIGGGTHQLWPDALQLDPIHGHEGLRTRVQDGIALPDASVDAAIASHVMEHIPAGAERIAALNEVHRVLVPQGTLSIIVPCVGYTDSSTGAPVHAGWQGWADPDHKSYWWYPESFWYLTGRYAAHADYGLLLWQLGPHELRDGWEARVTLIKP